MALVVHPANPERWADVERLFGERGACGGCWCMEWRLPRREFLAGKGESNRERLQALVAGERAPGVLAYTDAEPVGWCAVAPRAEYGFLSRSRILAPVDDEPVWSISCLFVDRRFRRQGVSRLLLQGAATFARNCGARVVEGYPIDAVGGQMADAFVWTGLYSSFVAAGFEEVRPVDVSR